VIAREFDHRGVTPLDVDEQVTRAIQLRVQGDSYSSIAAQVGRSVGWVRSVLTQAAKAALADRDAYFTMLVAETLWLKKRLLSPYILDETRRMDAKDALAAVKISEQLAKLLGLNAPIKVEGKFDFSGKTDEELALLAIQNGLAAPPLLADAHAEGDGEVPSDPAY